MGNKQTRIQIVALMLLLSAGERYEENIVTSTVLYNNYVCMCHLAVVLNLGGGSTGSITDQSAYQLGVIMVQLMLIRCIQHA